MVCPNCKKDTNWKHYVDDSGDVRECLECKEAFTDDFWIAFNYGYDKKNNCIWEKRKGLNIYDTHCMETFSIENNESLAKNKFKYCAFCGGEIDLRKW